jgi:hypothetical protein
MTPSPEPARHGIGTLEPALRIWPGYAGNGRIRLFTKTHLCIYR